MYWIYTGIKDFGAISFYFYRRIEENVSVTGISLFEILTASWVSELTKFDLEHIISMKGQWVIH